MLTVTLSAIVVEIVTLVTATYSSTHSMSAFMVTTTVIGGTAVNHLHLNH